MEGGAAEDHVSPKVDGAGEGEGGSASPANDLDLETAAPAPPPTPGDAPEVLLLALKKDWDGLLGVIEKALHAYITTCGEKESEPFFCQDYASRMFLKEGELDVSVPIEWETAALNDLGLDKEDATGSTSLNLAVAEGGAPPLVVRRLLEAGAMPGSLKEVTHSTEILGLLMKAGEQLGVHKFRMEIPRATELLGEFPDFDLKISWKMKARMLMGAGFGGNEMQLQKMGHSLRVEGKVPETAHTKAKTGLNSLLICGQDATHPKPGQVVRVFHKDKTVHDVLDATSARRPLSAFIQHAEEISKELEGISEVALDLDGVIQTELPKQETILGYKCRILEVSNVVLSAKREKKGMRGMAEGLAARFGSSKSLAITEKDGKMFYSGMAQIWLAEDFPLQKDQLTSVITAIISGQDQETRERLEKLKAFLELNMVGFPIKLQIPIGFGVTAVVSFGSMKFDKLDPLDKMLSIPEGYTWCEGAGGD